MPSTSLLRNPAIYWAIAVVTLLSGASFVYVSIKAPFFWGVIYLPGVVLLSVWALSTIAGAWAFLAKRRRGG
ncbi:MAG: hypothetical protein OK454_04465 [Thaumarchaeota archaeon]|nr:hypothetical protein [Nitrososphaerota archaeon]